MEGVLPKVRCQVIAGFYGKNVAKWEKFTICHFKKIECKKERHFACNAVAGCRRVRNAERKPCILTTVEELKVKLSVNNKKSVSIPNLVTFHSSAYLRPLGDSLLLFWAFFALC